MVNTNPTQIPYTFPLTGYYYVFEATGTLSVNQNLKPVTLAQSNLLGNDDISGSLQIKVPLSLFQLPSLNVVDGQFINDSNTIQAGQISSAITNANKIVSLGYIEDLYINYNNYVNAYFGNTTGFTPNFTSDIIGGSYDNSYNNSKVTAQNIVDLFHTTSYGIEGLVGSLTIGNLTNLLKYVCSADPFGNRGVGSNKTFQDGFQAGDLIFFKSGVTITLKTKINNNSVLLTSNHQFFSALDASSSALHTVIDDAGNYLITYDFDPLNDFTNTNLSLTATVPLLFILE